ncbi:pyridoxal phosphate-dependent aminotransferase [Candidatus Epulonipiscium viviparus]|uniref:pyridoxal phosphate-dependent aminotransferase n=1 Tax=Candidatus Epulonipiscium viviparus TaxID=420336 RepID=UPI0027380BB7|nr:pyridoxal phosphate-dependent aminotransferase [Candidatus Epulopiscium viviparus]
MISKKMQELVAGSSVIRAMFEEGKLMAQKYGVENVYDFSLGNPNTAPPDAIKEDIYDILKREEQIHGYMNNSGYEQTRNKIAAVTNAKYGLKLSVDNICMCVGAAGGLNIILKTILDPEDEVIVFAPFFGEYKHYISNFDGKIVVIPPNPPSFLPNFSALKASITPKTKAVIINTPNNPTGVIYDRATLTELANILEEKQQEMLSQIYLISDEPYREIVYNNVEVPNVLSFYKNTFIAYSYSKSLSLPGERIGYVISSSEMSDLKEVVAGLNVANRVLGFVNAPSLFQKLVERYVDFDADISLYKSNRDILYSHLKSLGFELNNPEGAFYLFPKALIEDDVEFCAEAKKFNLLLVPGSAFGCKGYFRIAYCVSAATVNNSLEAFAKLAKYYNDVVQ